MMEIKVPFLKSEVGAGDLVKTAAGAVGIRQSGDCGCRQRQQKWNGALKFVPRVASMPEGWALMESCKRAILCRRGDGAWMVWSIVDGQYANSHRFEGLDDAARQEYARRCR